jgi:hypothetical protein
VVITKGERWLAVRTKPADAAERERAIRLRAATLCCDNTALFIEMVRDSALREQAGADPVDALEQALNAVGA